MRGRKRQRTVPAILMGLLALAGLAGVNAQTQTASPAAMPAGPDHAKLWQAYASRFITADGRVTDPLRGDLTTSEGQSYALFFALVNNDRARFDKLFDWTQKNLAAGDIGGHLPAWEWGKAKDGHWGVLDPNSAADSDLWIAYDLVEAGRLWKDVNFAGKGSELAALIGRKELAELPGFGPALLPGPAGFRLQRSFVLNPSYSPPFLLERMAEIEPGQHWADAVAMLPALLERSARKGFAMDWVLYTPGAGFVPSQLTGKDTPPPVGSYDAIRVYLWIGMLANSDKNKAPLLKAMPGMSRYMAEHGASNPSPPEKISSQGDPGSQAGPVGFSAALVPYLEGNSNASAVAQQLVRIQSQLDEKSNLYGTGPGGAPTYYDQNLVLFGSGWYSKRFQFGSKGELLVRWSR